MPFIVMARLRQPHPPPDYAHTAMTMGMDAALAWDNFVEQVARMDPWHPPMSGYDRYADARLQERLLSCPGGTPIDMLGFRSSGAARDEQQPLGASSHTAMGVGMTTGASSAAATTRALRTRHTSPSSANNLDAATLPPSSASSATSATPSAPAPVPRSRAPSVTVLDASDSSSSGSSSASQPRVAGGSHHRMSPQGTSGSVAPSDARALAAQPPLCSALNPAAPAQPTLAVSTMLAGSSRPTATGKPRAGRRGRNAAVDTSASPTRRASRSRSSARAAAQPDAASDHSDLSDPESLLPEVTRPGDPSAAVVPTPFEMTSQIAYETIASVWRKEGIKPPVVDIPASVRPAMARLLLRLLADVLCENTERPPPLSYVWPLVVAGRVRTAVMKKRVRLALQGDIQALFDSMSEVCDDPPLPGATDPLRRARTLFSRGDTSKGIAALGHTGSRVVPQQDEIDAKFPLAAQPLPSPVSWMEDAPGAIMRRATSADDLSPQRSWQDVVADAIKAPAYSSAAGPDGIRPAHLRQLCTVRLTGPLVLATFSQVVERYLRGRLHPAFDQVALSPVPKPDGGWRPIGVGSVARRAALRIAASQLRRDVSGELELRGQLGLAQAGPQRVYIRAQHCLQSGLSLVRLDVRNAFNCAERGAISAAISDVGGRLNADGAPSAALQVGSAVYARTTLVHPEDGMSFESNRGVVQGCPMGSALFAVTMAAVLSETALRMASLPEPLRLDVMLPEGTVIPFQPRVLYQVALHDDVVIAGHSLDLLAVAVGCFRQALAQSGMSLAAGKAVLLSPREASPTCLETMGATQRSSTLLAGAPLYLPHEEAFAEANQLLTEQVRSKLQPLYNARRLRDPQDVIRAASMAGSWSRIQYLHSLTSHFPAWPSLLRVADELSHTLVSAALGPHADEARPLAWTVAILPRRLGGLGIQACSLAASLSGAKAIRDLDLPDRGPRASAAVAAAKSKALTSLHRRILSALMRVVADEPVLLAILRHAAGKASGSPWHCLATSRDGTLLPPNVAHMALHLRLLGSPTLQNAFYLCGENRPDRIPGVGPTGAERLHLETCPTIVGARHTAIIRCVRKVAETLAPGSVEAEVTPDEFGIARPALRDERRPGDLAFWVGAGNVFLDFTVALPAAGLQLEEARRPGRSVCEEAWKLKKREYHDMFAEGTARFIPVPFSALGGAHPVTLRGLRELAAAVEANARVLTPLGAKPLWSRFRDAATSQIVAATAKFALRLRAQNQSLDDHTQAADTRPDDAIMERLASFLPRARLLREALRIASPDEDDGSEALSELEDDTAAPSDVDGCNPAETPSPPTPTGDIRSLESRTAGGPTSPPPSHSQPSAPVPNSVREEEAATPSGPGLPQSDSGHSTDDHSRGTPDRRSAAPAEPRPPTGPAPPSGICATEPSADARVHLDPLCPRSPPSGSHTAASSAAPRRPADGTDASRPNPAPRAGSPRGRPRYKPTFATPEGTQQETPSAAASRAGAAVTSATPPANGKGPTTHAGDADGPEQRAEAAADAGARAAARSVIRGRSGASPTASTGPLSARPAAPIIEHSSQPPSPRRPSSLSSSSTSSESCSSPTSSSDSCPSQPEAALPPLNRLAAASGMKGRHQRRAQQQIKEPLSKVRRTVPNPRKGRNSRRAPKGDDSHAASAASSADRPRVTPGPNGVG